MRIGVLTSPALPGVETLIRQSRVRELFELTAVVISGPTNRQIDVPLVVRPMKENGQYRNLRAREDYDRATADLFHSLQTDFIFLLGYPYVLTEGLVEAFPQKLIAVHDGDLTRLDDEGHRRYTGLHAVREAILAGEPDTRNSLYFVTTEVAGGPLFLQSERYAVSDVARAAVTAGDYEDVKEYAALHRRWMRRSWGTLTLQAIEHLSLGEISFAGDLVWIDGVPGPCRHGDAPNMCFERGASIQRELPASCPFIRK